MIKMKREHQEESLFSFLPLRVLVVNSDIYSLNSEELEKENNEVNVRDFVLSVLVYKCCWVPLSSLMEELIKESKLNFEGRQVLYKTSNTNTYILTGTFPFDNNMLHLKIESVEDQIFIKYRIADKVPIPEKKLKARRGNERKISDVIESLVKWRKLSASRYLSTGRKGKKLNKQEAADILRIPKKSLEDYMLQIKIAYENGFDFNMYSNTRFGIIRDFNRRMRI